MDKLPSWKGPIQECLLTSEKKNKSESLKSLPTTPLGQVSAKSSDIKTKTRDGQSAKIYALLEMDNVVPSF